MIKIRFGWTLARAGIWLHDAGMGVLGDASYLELMRRCGANGRRQALAEVARAGRG